MRKQKGLLKKMAAGIMALMLVMSSVSYFGNIVNAEENSDDEEIIVQTDSDADQDEEYYGRTVVDGGKDGGVSWTLYDDGFLDIKVTGDLSHDPTIDNEWPWIDTYKDKKNAVEIKNVKVSGKGLTNASGMFATCGSIESYDFSGFDTGKITNMNQMFYNNWFALKKLDLSNFDTRNVTNMMDMFGHCEALESLNISSFDTSNVKDMSFMFDGCRSIKSLDLKKFNTSKVSDMSFMFRDCYSLSSLNVRSFNTSNVRNMELMFYNCKSLASLDLSSFDMTEVYYDPHDRDADNMLRGCNSLKTLKTPKKLPDNLWSREYNNTIKLPGIYKNKAGQERKVIKDTNDVYTRIVGIMVMYRMYNPNSGEHFYTSNTDEVENLVNAGWQDEGVAWNAPSTSQAPVYRLYNPNAGDHHYTTSVTEKDNLVKVGWKYEGIGWYSDDSKGVALQRLYNPNAQAGSHHYTISVAEKENLEKAGWKYEGIAWYGMK